VIDALATGLKQGDGETHLITFHPRGPGLSSDSLADATWLDFNMFQSSHGGHDHDNGLFAQHDYALQPPKPTLDSEPRYECMPVGFYFADASRLRPLRRLRCPAGSLLVAAGRRLRSHLRQQQRLAMLAARS
jgi:hypothetical protein